MPTLHRTQLSHEVQQHYKGRAVYESWATGDWQRLDVRHGDGKDIWQYKEGCWTVVDTRPREGPDERLTLPTKQYMGTFFFHRIFDATCREMARAEADAFFISLLDHLPEEIRQQIRDNSRSNVAILKDKGPRKSHKIITLATFPAEDFLRKGHKRQQNFEVEGVTYRAKVHCYRLMTFSKNPACVVCGLKGTEIRLQRQVNHPPGRAHLNLFGLTPQGRWMMLTVDHIVSRSKGGPDHPDNYQTMCERCNRFKADDDLTIEEVRLKVGMENPEQ